MDLNGRNAVVTGVSRRAGIGYAIARRLIDAGASVFVHGWTPHDAAQEWGAEPGGTEAIARELGIPFVEADFADADAPARVIAAAAEALGPLDLLVVNHARSGHGRLAECLPRRSTRSCTRTSARRCSSSASSLRGTTTRARAAASC